MQQYSEVKNKDATTRSQLWKQVWKQKYAVYAKRKTKHQSMC